MVKKHLNQLRWISLITVFSTLVLLPATSVYQSYRAAHAYDLLAVDEKLLYDSMEVLTSVFVSDPVEDLQHIKGTTWSANFYGFKISDPLAVAGQLAASLNVNWGFINTAIIPVLLSLLLGRFFCGWICPATLLFELNSNFALLWEKMGFRTGKLVLDRRIKYLVLGLGLLVSMVTGIVWAAAIYPPALIGREIYYAIALGGFSSGAVFLVACLLFDLLVARRGFCRYLCPGGALYALLGRYRVLRIQRKVTSCNDCARCNAVCEFGLAPMSDQFGADCNNCTACIAACPTNALVFHARITDQPAQGPGHLGHEYKKQFVDASIIATDNRVEL